MRLPHLLLRRSGFRRPLTTTAALGVLLVIGTALPGYVGQVAQVVEIAHAPERVAPPFTAAAHRGASSYAPENTLAAFEVALAQGAAWLETDVQLTADGVPVLMHDTTLVRTTDARRMFPDRAPWRVGDFTLEEIRTLDAGSWFDAEFAGERVPTLSELVALARGTEAGLLVELKAPARHPGIERAVIDELAAFPGYIAHPGERSRLTVMSFDWEAMRAYAALSPRTPIGLLGAPPASALPRYAVWASQVNPGKKGLDPAYIEAAHSAGLDVNVWTVNDRKTMRALLDAGADGIITNRPDVLGRLLAAR